MIGIRREDKNEWERRTPLIPDHVRELTQAHGIQFAVQPSAHRAFADTDFVAAGAALEEDLSRCGVILGVKEVPPGKLIEARTYLFFSHTTKGQAYNMPLLRRLLELRCTLIDYERILDERGRRLIFFGRHAGYAGMIDTLWALGQRLAAEGFATPFDQVLLAHQYPSLDEATHHISRIGEHLREVGLPPGLRPLVFGFTGSGNVSRGAQEIFDRLPTLEVHPDDLPDLFRRDDPQGRVVYKVRFEREHRFERIGGGEIDLGDVALHPERYRNGLMRWLPFVNVLVHGAFWEPPQPRVASISDLRQLWADGPPRLRLISDISCDVAGGVEATLRATTPGNPVYVYDLDRAAAVDGVHGRGPVILAVDNLPCQLPSESSRHFGDTLLSFTPALAACDWKQPLEQLPLPESILQAVIVHQGRLTPRYSYLKRSLAQAGSGGSG